MKPATLFLLSFIFLVAAKSQSAITAVVTSSNAAPTSYSYLNGGNTYNWGLSPNNTTVSVNGFTAGGINYSYAATLVGNVKLRRVNNALTSGNFSLVWAEQVTAGTVFNMFPAYQSDMEAFFNNRTYNKGTDNFFDNTSSNSNNIERLDWILNSPYLTPTPAKIGFAIFERGATAAHDPFCIAAITSLDGLGNPASYSNIVRVLTANYGEPGPSVSYRILKGPAATNLLDAGTGNQNRGGVIISLQNLGIVANQPIYGYSLFSNDLPGGATPANLVDYTSPTYFPINTGNPGGIDLVAVTGIYVENSILPVSFISFNAVNQQNTVNLNWKVENESGVNKYEVERSTDGINFLKVSVIYPNSNTPGVRTYTSSDNVSSVLGNQLYYRIKQYDQDNSYYYSKTLAIKRNVSTSSITIYPNPVGNNLYVNIASTSNDKIMISIFNKAGSQLLIKNEQISTGINSINIEHISQLPKGMYSIRVLFESGRTASTEFIKN